MTSPHEVTVRRQDGVEVAWRCLYHECGELVDERNVYCEGHRG